MNEQEASAQRVKRLWGLIIDESLDALLIRTTSDIAWATAFPHVFDEEQAHALLVTRDACILHTDSRYSAACRAAAGGTPIVVEDERVSHASWVAEHLKALPDTGTLRLGIEDTLSIREFRALEKCVGDHVSLLPQRNPGMDLRAVKDELEVEAMKRAQAITDATFTHIIGFIRPGMTERQVRIEMDEFMVRSGADGLSFPTIVATGPHAASPHAVPGDTVIEAGHAIVMDFGAKLNGYCSDMTRMVFVGEPGDEQRRAYACLRQANESCEAMIAAGVNPSEVHEHAEQVLAEHGFAHAMGHALGHGVGLDIHELPVLSPAPKTAEGTPAGEVPLRVGNVVTVEPGIYLEGKFGMRLEDFGVVMPTTYDVFTTSTHDMVII